MPEPRSTFPLPLSPAPEAAWRFTLDPFAPHRRPTREVRVGDVGIGGANPVRIQSMTVADTQDTAAVVEEICQLHAAGSEIVRVTVPNRAAALALGPIRAQLERQRRRVPLVADIHFTPGAALLAAQYVDKVRVNPGNYADRKRFERREYTDAEYSEELQRLEAAFRPLVRRCRELGVALRIGTNHGSLSDRILNRYGDTPLGMVESALEFVRICEQHGHRDLVLSMKASNVKVMIEAYRLLSLRMRELGMDYPFHLGVTEAGAGLAARVKSAIGIASLLADGIGDTIRVSLTEDSVHEIPVARALVAWQAPAAAAPPRIAPAPPPPWDPLRFERRRATAAGSGPARLAGDRPPRIEVVVHLPVEPAAAVARAERIADMGGPEDAGPDLLLLAVPPEVGPESARPALTALGAWIAARAPEARPAVGIECPARWTQDAALRAALTAGARLSLRVACEADVQALAGWGDDAARPPVQVVIRLGGGEPAALDAALRWAAAVAGGAAALALECDGTPGPHAVRRFLALWRGHELPLVLRAGAPDPRRVDDHATAGALATAVGLGSLLVDGVGDALQIDAGADPETAAALLAEILQATRARLSKADFIACPSCGRTQFDLQTTTAAIESRLRHLKGLKIAVMGCIVNGPGEMADADFGYVGSGPGRIDLYVGHERVERHVPAAEAVDRLVELIRRHGRWVDPPFED